jgi:hypothetical protein
VFGMLETYLVSGTPKRVRKNDTRAWDGIELAPSRVVLSHAGERPPIDTPEGAPRPPRPRRSGIVLRRTGRAAPASVR